MSVQMADCVLQSNIEEGIDAVLFHNDSLVSVLRKKKLPSAYNQPVRSMVEPPTTE